MDRQANTGSSWRLIGTTKVFDPASGFAEIANVIELTDATLARGGGWWHCPEYVRGFYPDLGTWIERIYYAGASENPWGPYGIGYLEWDGQGWREQSEPVFVAAEDWERGSVYEPNLVYA